MKRTVQVVAYSFDVDGGPRASFGHTLASLLAGIAIPGHQQ